MTTRHPKEIERIKSRRAQGLTYSEIKDEFDCAHSSAHRYVNKNGEKHDKED